MPDWSTRIPAAIEKGRLIRAIFGPSDDMATQWFGHALALAEALERLLPIAESGLNCWDSEFSSGISEEEMKTLDDTRAALRAFTEKVESLGGGE